MSKMRCGRIFFSAEHMFGVSIKTLHILLKEFFVFCISLALGKEQNKAIINVS